MDGSQSDHDVSMPDAPEAAEDPADGTKHGVSVVPLTRKRSPSLSPKSKPGSKRRRTHKQSPSTKSTANKKHEPKGPKQPSTPRGQPNRLDCYIPSGVTGEMVLTSGGRRSLRSMGPADPVELGPGGPLTLLIHGDPPVGDDIRRQDPVDRRYTTSPKSLVTIFQNTRELADHARALMEYDTDTEEQAAGTAAIQQTQTEGSLDDCTKLRSQRVVRFSEQVLNHFRSRGCAPSRHNRTHDGSAAENQESSREHRKSQFSENFNFALDGSGQQANRFGGDGSGSDSDREGRPPLRVNNPSRETSSDSQEEKNEHDVAEENNEHGVAEEKNENDVGKGEPDKVEGGMDKGPKLRREKRSIRDDLKATDGKEDKTTDAKAVENGHDKAGGVEKLSGETLEAGASSTKEDSSGSRNLEMTRSWEAGDDAGPSRLSLSPRIKAEDVEGVKMYDLAEKLEKLGARRPSEAKSTASAPGKKDPLRSNPITRSRSMK